MQRFTELFNELDASNRTNDKVRALVRYFSEAPPEDAAWALALMMGRRIKRSVNTRLLRVWAAEASGYPLWMLEECYERVGDLAETIALMLGGESGTNVPLHQLIEERLLPLPKAEESEKKKLILQTWSELDARQKFVFHKLLGGGFRVGVGKVLVNRALAQVAGVEPAIMAHRLAGNWEPTADDYQQLLNESESGADDPARPYPFYLAYALEDEPEELGDPSDWIIEWKWDGIRCELIKRQGEVLLWSRGEELVTDRFPEVVAAAECLPDGTVLDGELLAWQDDHPLPFIKLQQRIGRKKVGKTILKNVPVSFMAYDVMEAEGEDVRAKPQHERRGLLEKSISSTDWKDEKPLLLSPLLDCKKWDELRAERERSREFGVEGMMLKKREAHYGVGRTKGDWWKWKVDPFTCDCVMIYAQRGHGRRASLYTDYTFAVWNDGELVPVMKAYSGLTDAEIRRVDKWVRAHTLERFGPVRSVTPGLVMELAFEGINSSSRHKSGVAVRFPRISRWRHDKPIEEADTLESLKALMKIQENVKPVSS